MAKKEDVAVLFVGSMVEHGNLVTVTRFRRNRVFYRQSEPQAGTAGKGHPRWYGERFALNDPATWGDPDEVVCENEGKCPAG